MNLLFLVRWVEEDELVGRRRKMVGDALGEKCWLDIGKRAPVEMVCVRLEQSLCRVVA